MAELKRAVLGRVSGSVGNITGRIRRGKNYISARPASFMPGKDAASIERRRKFKLALEFGLAIIQNSPDLKLIWQKATRGLMGPHNLIVKQNYKLIGGDGYSVLNHITPADGFPVTVNSFEINNSVLTSVIAPLGNPDLFNLELEQSVKMINLLYNTDPNLDGIDPYSFQVIESSDNLLQLDNPLTFTITLNSVQESLYSKYGSHKIYSALITLDSGVVPVSYSQTIAR